MLMIRLFRSAGATGHVFLMNNSRSQDKGLAYSGFIGPMTTVAVVPTTPQILNFAIIAQTKDKQKVTVSGNITASLIPAVSVRKFDFTVDVGSGGYQGDWSKTINALIVERAVRAVHAKLRDLDVEDATRSQKEVEDAIMAELGGDNLAIDGISVTSCSIPKIDPDNEVSAAIGASERQTMLAAADMALHDRRLKAAGNDRAVREFDAQTNLKLEEERAKLIDEQGKNKEKEAEADAKATELRLAPLKDIDAGKLLGAALIEGLKEDRIGTIVIGPELLGALQQK